MSTLKCFVGFVVILALLILTTFGEIILTLGQHAIDPLAALGF